MWVQSSICKDELPDSTVQNQKIIEDSWLGKDKLKHLVASFYCSGSVEWIAHHEYGLYRNQSRRVGIAFSLSMGIAKEIYDIKRHGIFSWKDMVFDLLGALCAAVLINW